jgi:hypothetical protein
MKQIPASAEVTVTVTKTITVTREQAENCYNINTNSTDWPEDVAVRSQEHYDNREIDVSELLDVYDDEVLTTRFDVTGVKFD